MSTRVGVRELRQNLSVYLRRILKGESFEVTEHGRPVALLTPLPKGESLLDRLIAEGRLWPATRSTADLRAPRGKRSTHGSDALREMREDRI